MTYLLADFSASPYYKGTNLRRDGVTPENPTKKGRRRTVQALGMLGGGAAGSIGLNAYSKRFRTMNVTRAQEHFDLMRQNHPDRITKEGGKQMHNNVKIAKAKLEKALSARNAALTPRNAVLRYAIGGTVGGLAGLGMTRLLQGFDKSRKRNLNRY